MEAAPVNIVQYFDGSKQGVIPLFQRPYSWDTKDWTTLWDDLMGRYHEDERSSHFMGAVVTVPVKSVPVGVAKHLVIDGQQRLTTLSILLVAIRDKAMADKDATTAGIVGDLLVNRHYASPDDLKVVPTQVDRAAYNALIYSKEFDQYEESRIVQAYKFFTKKLDGVDSEGEGIVNAQVLRALQQSLQVVMINLGETDDPYLIFESLNHKGKPLEPADLVRNYVLMRFHHSTTIGGEQQVAYEDLWRPMEEKLNSSMTEFLRHYGMRNGRNVRKGEIYAASKSEFAEAKEIAEVRKKLREMKSGAFAYEKFIHPDEEHDPTISKQLSNIQELDSTVFYPLLLRLYRAWTENVLATDGILDALSILESFYVRRLVCAVPTNAVNGMTLELCSSLPSENQNHWLRDKLKSNESSTRRWPTDEEFAEKLLRERLYPRRNLAKYVLVALEQAHKHKEPVDAAGATIEHIMPQTLNDDWKQDLGVGYVEIHDQWLDTLGNLTLTGYNAELGNESFGNKKLKLQNTHFELTRPLLQCAKWGAEEIESRGRILTTAALQRWARR